MKKVDREADFVFIELLLFNSRDQVKFRIVEHNGLAEQWDFRSRVQKRLGGKENYAAAAVGWAKRRARESGSVK